MTKTIAILSSATVLFACDYLKPTGVQVDVRRHGNQYLIVPTSCRGKPIGIRAIRIARLGQGQADTDDDYYCHVQVPMSKAIKGPWSYGSTPPYASMSKCLGLKPGQYVVNVSGGEAGGYRDFQIRENGDVSLGQGSCE